MGMNIKDPQVHAMARELAARRGTSVTEAVRQALGAELTRAKEPGPEDIRSNRLEAIRQMAERGVGALLVLWPSVVGVTVSHEGANAGGAKFENAVSLCGQEFHGSVKLSRFRAHAPVKVELLDAVEFATQVGVGIETCRQSLAYPERTRPVLAKSGEGVGQTFIWSHVLQARVPERQTRPARGRLDNRLGRYQAAKTVAEQVCGLVPAERVERANEIMPQSGESVAVGSIGTVRVWLSAL